MAKNEGARKTNLATVQSILPDVCWTPMGSKNVKVNYTITSKLSFSVRTTKQVHFKGLDAFTMASRTTRVEGDEAGTGGGIYSGVNLGWCRPTTHANAVNAGGSYVIRHTSLFHMNCDGPEGTPNTVGKLVYLNVMNAAYSKEITAADVAQAVDMLSRSNRPGWWSKVSSAFEQRVREIAKEFNIDADDIMACMSYESGGLLSAQTFSQNPNSAATGLFQFIPGTAQDLLKTSTKAEAMSRLMGMSDLEQLEVVRLQLLGKASKIKTLDDIYLAVHHPASVGKPLGGTVYAEGSNAYAGHTSLDTNKDGKVTVQEATVRARAEREKQRQAEAAAKQDGGVIIRK